MEEKIINIDVARDELTSAVIDCGLYVHRELGPGLLESAYEQCLSLLLLKRGIPHKRQVLMPVKFCDEIISDAYRLDMVVADRLIIELKTHEKILPVHEAQILTYLKLSNIKTGLIMNFKTKLFRDGLKRYVL